MFTGEYNHTVDAKGRIVLPARFREELGDLFYITKGNVADKQMRYVRVFTKQAWEEYSKKLMRIPESNKVASKFARAVLSGTGECSPDKNGRILIPENLRAFAGIDKDVVSIGGGDKIEIWDRTRWIDYGADDIDEAELSEALAEYDL